MTVLIIDDTESITQVLEKYLPKKGYNVKVCNDGFEGLKRIQDEGWDCILLDVCMPDLSGYQIIERLQKDNMLGGKKIVLYTATEVPQFLEEKLLTKYGVKSILKKPCSLKMVMDAITV